MFDYVLFKQLSAKNKDAQKPLEVGFIKTEIAKRLIDKLLFIRCSPQTICLEGEFPQTAIKRLKQRYPDVVISDTLQTNSDMILSNGQLHLTDDLSRTLQRYGEHLKPDGILLFSTFGSTHLEEIKKCWQGIDPLPHINAMLDMHDLGDMLLKSPFYDAVMDSETLNLQYDHIDKLIADIRALNEPLSDTKMRRTLTGKHRWQRFVLALEKSLSLSCEIVYGYALKWQKNTSQKLDETTIRIDIDTLKKSLQS